MKDPLIDSDAKKIPSNVLNKKYPQHFWILITLFSVISLGLHLHRLEVGYQVSWDEVHFGKMASWYINRTYFFDVHPPLGKLMIAGLGHVVGYNGSFEWMVGQNFSDNYEILEMRYGFAILGSSLVPLSFLTTWTLTESLTASVIAGTLTCFDTGLTSLTRFILLDQPLLVFIALSFLSCVIFDQVPSQDSFSKHWTVKMATVGICLGLVISVKLVGLFIILFAGLQTINDLWNLFTDLAVNFKLFLRHFLYRVVFLILVPIGIYVLLSLIHLIILTKAGNGDAYHSPLFQSYLEDNYYSTMKSNLIVRNNAVITLSADSDFHRRLHSHWDLLPVGAGTLQQMVGTYVHHDDNNKWIIRQWPAEQHNSTAIVHHGDLVTLTHKVTGRNLHSHYIPALADKKMFQVTGYGDNGHGDENDIWRVEIVGGHSDTLLTPFSPFQLRHKHLGCLLTDNGHNLPKEWGYTMHEVACSPWLRKTKEHHGLYASQWEIAENEHDKDTNRKLIRDFGHGIWSRFLEGQLRMLEVSNMIGIDNENDVAAQKSHKAWKWPFNLNTQNLTPNPPRITLVGNPFVYGINLLALLIYIPYLIFTLIKKERPGNVGCDDNSDEALKKLFLAYILHYAPFFFMSRVLYIHHYYPALYFSCILTGVFMDKLLSHIPGQFIQNAVRVTAVSCVSSCAILTFVYFSPVVYGMEGDDENKAKMPESTYHHLHWISSWDL